ncbi:MAG: glycosyltransferase [Planctomycetota bacterium]|nr:glycosyltransferase [Planctomycetota bacterium]
MISYVIPTRDRPERLRATLHRLTMLGDHAAAGGAEVVIVDNDSRERLVLPRVLAGGIGVRQVLLPTNEGAAARNHGVRASDPRSAWIVMLDDDSYPLDLGFAGVLARQGADVGAVSADIWLQEPAGETFGVRESGGLPEVFIGCGVAIRREVFLRLGGYDPAFGYYAEEYDLAAKMLLAGLRVAFEPAFRVRHEKVSANRDMNLILERLVRNNGWVMQRYAPEHERLERLREVRRRYRAIAVKERALDGFGRGLTALRETVREQPRTPMSHDLWDRFTGLAAARAALGRAHAARPFASAALVDEGKNAWAVVRALEELGVRLAGESEEAAVRVVGTLSPGPMLDAIDRRRRWHAPHLPMVLAPWDIGREATNVRRPSRRASPAASDRAVEAGARGEAA